MQNTTFHGGKWMTTSPVRWPQEGRKPPSNKRHELELSAKWKSPDHSLAARKKIRQFPKVRLNQAQGPKASAVSETQHSPQKLSTATQQFCKTLAARSGRNQQDYRRELVSFPERQAYMRIARNCRPLHTLQVFHFTQYCWRRGTQKTINCCSNVRRARRNFAPRFRGAALGGTSHNCVHSLAILLIQDDVSVSQFFLRSRWLRVSHCQEQTSEDTGSSRHFSETSP